MSDPTNVRTLLLNEEESRALGEILAWTVQAHKGQWLYRPDVKLPIAVRLAERMGVSKSRMRKPEEGGR